MRFEQTSLPGIFVISLEPHHDQRGWFARTFCREELAEHGIEMEVAQANTSYNERAGTLRGMHYQAAPHAEQKLVWCDSGAVFDVTVDVRDGSVTRGDWFATELSAENKRTLYVPEGFAHGYQTLTDGAEVSYLVSHRYTPEAERGVRWDDPSIGIEWPDVAERIISDRDRSLPGLEP
jgi:dTDP-4-dehydrorhamnose 3,5-epimerase